MMKEADVAWFQLDNYSAPKLKKLGLRKWADLVEHRWQLSMTARSGAKEELTRLFEPLKTNPLQTPGLTRRERSLRHSTDTASVALMRAGEIYELATLASTEQMNVQVCIDLPAGRPRKGRPGHIAHLRVDLAANPKQLVRDFRLWLNAMRTISPPPAKRNYATTIVHWAEHSYLPYSDLILYEFVAEKRISPMLMVKLLGLRTHPDPKDELKAASKCLSVFTGLTVSAMRAQIDAEDVADESLWTQVELEPRAG